MNKEKKAHEKILDILEPMYIVNQGFPSSELGTALNLDWVSITYYLSTLMDDGYIDGNRDGEVYIKRKGIIYLEELQRGYIKNILHSFFEAKKVASSLHTIINTGIAAIIGGIVGFFLARIFE